MKIIVWYRGDDLRVSDHEPLILAAKGGEVIPAVTLDSTRLLSEHWGKRPRRYLLESLAELAHQLGKRGSRLVVLRGEAPARLLSLFKAEGVDKIFAYRSVDPERRKEEELLKKALGERLVFFEGKTLLPLGAVTKSDGEAYRVYNPFALRVREQLSGSSPLKAPRRLSAVSETLGDACAELERDGSGGAVGLLGAGGEVEARKRLKRFVTCALSDYCLGRDKLGINGTSLLSADLRFGTLSVRSVYRAIQELPASPQTRRFVDQLIWREFAQQTLFHFPELLAHPFRKNFEKLPWKRHDKLLTAWKEGRTGYPVVDAAARQLMQEGYVHNRARMIAASFLTKHLMVHYRHGEEHYLNELVDGDVALNNMGWQWSAGCGCDAQPYFRVFNPVLQGQKFDPDGAYVGRYVPELSQLPSRFVHRPWEASAEILRLAKLKLGVDYPLPIVDHRFARQRFLTQAKKSQSEGNSSERVLAG